MCRKIEIYPLSSSFLNFFRQEFVIENLKKIRMIILSFMFCYLRLDTLKFALGSILISIEILKFTNGVYRFFSQLNILNKTIEGFYTV